MDKTWYVDDTAYVIYNGAWHKVRIFEVSDRYWAGCRFDTGEYRFVRVKDLRPQPNSLDLREED